MTPDLLNFKKGWMSKLDENGEWKKHWFVLTDAGLRYYRDSGAEEKDDLDGEIDLKSCVKVSEFDVEKNYGFQIQTREALFTLSAMTAGIRKNWIEVLRKSVRPICSPDLTQSGDKENSHSLSRPLSSRWPSTRQHHGDPRSEVTSSGSAPRHFDYVELAPMPAASPSPTASQRDGPEQITGHSQWEALLHRKGAGSGPVSEQRQLIEEEIEKKWAEFEKLPLKEMRSLPLIGSRAGRSANEALQREVASLKLQLERARGGGGAGGGAGGWGAGWRPGCGPDAACGRSLAAMERAHTHALEEMQKQHERETRKLERERDRLLWEETQATAQAMEALKKAHREELQREVERVRRLCGGAADTAALQAQHQSETRSLRRELDSLSERYSQKCLQLNRAEQCSGEREREISRREREMEQLRKENQELQSRLVEEISRMRKGEGSEVITPDNRERNSCELEVLLRVKEKEAQYLYREITCLRSELQSLQTEKQTACERYREVFAELNLMKSRSEQEIETLKEHLRLAMAALQERQQLGNSLDH
ncbi:hypothetical protein GJAV_G00226200 [Gymnothorax javanicus]|nr:hypothetical protein GJAV_G00226200 [Gymnothorax javanicus]